MTARILFYDIECKPLTVHTWGLRDQFIAINQIKEDPAVIGVGAMWLGDKRAKFYGLDTLSREEMLTRAHELLDQADLAIGYNSQGFDAPWLHAEFAKEGMAPPSPFKHVDLFKAARKAFRLPSYKLQYVSGWLGVGSKIETGGFGLWERCMAGDEKAWRLMNRYCRQDVELLPALYHRLRPWISNHPNLALYGEGSDRPSCERCGSQNLHARGWAVTTTRRYQRYQCQACGGWTRDNTADADVKALTRGVQR